MRHIFTFIAVLMLLLTASCSGTSHSPISPEATEQPLAEAIPGDYGVLYEGTFEIDLENMQITNYENRQSSLVYNITGFLPDKCPGGCFRFSIVGIVGTVLEIELVVENPVDMTVYDLRIQYTNLFGKTVLNPDSYTDFLGTQVTQIYPFTAFAKEEPNRAFPVGPGVMETETLYLDFPPGSPAAVNYAITASLPGNTQEPYEISDMEQIGTLTPEGGTATIRCKIKDHQDDISMVLFDSRPLMGTITRMMPAATADYFEAEVTNSMGIPVGEYSGLIMAMSPNPQNISTYNYANITVSEEIVSGDLVVVQTWSDMYVSTPDRSEITYLGVSGYHPIISQDNSVIVYVTSTAGNIRAINPDGTNDRLVLAGNYRWPTVTADGSSIAFWDSSTPTACYRVDIDGSNFVKITPDYPDPEEAENWRHAAISGDGSRIAMLNSSERAIYISDGDGSNLTHLIDTGSTASFPSITYDGTWIFYNTPFRINRIRWDGTDDQRVIGQAATSRYAINPAGTWVSYTQHFSDPDPEDPETSSGNDLMSYDIVNDIERRLTFEYGDRNAGSKTVTVDGSWVITDGFATRPMYSMRTDGTGEIVEWGAGDHPTSHGTRGHPL